MHMAAAMARQEDQFGRAEPAEQQLVGRIAPRRGNLAPLGVLQPGHAVDAAAAQHADAHRIARLRHMRLRDAGGRLPARSEEHTSELQSLMRISYAVFRLKNKKTISSSTAHTTQ